MNKIEEILKNKGITPTTKYHNYEYLYNSIKESIEEFGKLAFEAGWREITYEDFLKEIKNE